MNKASEIPLGDSEVKTTVESAWSRITNKELQFDGTDKIDNVVMELREKNTFVTLKKTDEILSFNGKIYDKAQAEAVIKEETERQITESINRVNCHKSAIFCKPKILFVLLTGATINLIK